MGVLLRVEAAWGNRSTRTTGAEGVESRGGGAVLSEMKEVLALRDSEEGGDS
jgi:hypothetical protein